MKPALQTLASIAGACLMVTPSLAEAGEWKLVWSDEFDGAGLPDARKWGYEEGFVRNQEKQIYTAKRLRNANGKHRQ